MAALLGSHLVVFMDGAVPMEVGDSNVVSKSIKREDLVFNLLLFLLDGYEHLFCSSPSTRKVGDWVFPPPPLSFSVGKS